MNPHSEKSLIPNVIKQKMLIALFIPHIYVKQFVQLGN